MSTAMNYLFQWANGESWKIHILNKIIMRQEIAPEQLAGEVLELLRNSSQVDQISVLDVKESDNDEVLVITELKKPKNINALASDVAFSLGKNLNVFYGENGSGKSSYVRMFRKLAEHYYTAAKHLPIFPNVFAEVAPSDSPWQTVEVTYVLDETKHCDVVDINSPHPALSKMNVFDSESVIPLINADLSFNVLPKGFEFFQQTSTVLDTLRTEISTLIDNDESRCNALFADSSFELVRDELVQIMTQVRAVDIKQHLDSNFPRSESFDEDIEEIDLQIKELETANPKDKITILTAQKVKLEGIARAIQELGMTLTPDNIGKVNYLIQEYEAKLIEEREINELFQKSISFLEVVNEEWLSFIKAGRQYYNSIHKSNVDKNDTCIFCTQPLDITSIEVIERYFQHVDDSSKNQRGQIEKEIMKFHVSKVLVGVADDEVALFENVNLLERIKSVVQLVNRNMELFSRCLTDKSRMEPTIALDVTDLVSDIVQEVSDLTNRMADLVKSQSEINAIISSRKALKLTIQRNEKLHASSGLLVEWLTLQDSIKRRTTAKNKCSTVSLTQKQRDAFEEIVQTQYLETFDYFAQQLNVVNVNIKLIPQKGKTVRKKFVAAEEYKVSDIMSEGEQKAIAMVEFVTDLTMRKDTNPVLFDDPVTSLDYKRAELFANQIYQLSLERQVLVFTHNIMFYYFLYNACFKSNNQNNKFFKVDEFDMMNKGIVSESFSGRLENLAQVTKDLRKQGQTINSHTCVGDTLEDALKKAYSDMRTWCELIVEEGFFKSMIRRYEPNVRFTSVTQIDGNFVAELPIVSELFDKACRWMAGHSQPTETQHVRATREAFNSDLEYINLLYVRYK